MNLEDFQEDVFDRLSGSVGLDGVTILKEDGSWPQSPAREKALRDDGLVIIVWEADPEGVLSAADDGTTVFLHGIHVVIEEAVSVNRGTSGTGITGEEATRHVLARLAGALRENFGGGLVALDPPFKNFGVANGVQRIVVGFGKQFTVVPEP